MIRESALEKWSVQKAAEWYGVPNWGGGYFRVDENGHLVVHPKPDRPELGIDLMDVVEGARERGMEMPVLVRLEDMLAARIRLLHNSFSKAIAESGYRSPYRGVYPIKVNQQQQVVEGVVQSGAPFKHGLEAGSKAELIAALSFITDEDTYLICNGYKDREFIDLGLQALKMGIQCFLVVETPGELELILDRADHWGLKPLLGLRAKLSSVAGGHWKDSGGDRSAFGLNTAETVDAVDVLRSRERLDCLRLLHYHLGSQIPNIRDIRAAVTEACRIYAGLVNEGATMGVLDLGGGLAVDYDGSHTNFPSSSNYDLGEYCADIIEVIMSVLDPAGIEHPIIVTESGRATVAYYSILLFNVLNVGRFETHPLPGTLPEKCSTLTRSLLETAQSVTSKNIQEVYHDALYYRDEIRQLFRLGHLSLRERGMAESIFWHIILKVIREIRNMKYVPDEFEGLDSNVADIYYGNFSLFQSLPDVWAIEQLFPIMPIHRLDEMPTRKGIISDITCDCDGRIDRFIDLHDVKHTLPLHELKNGEEYYLGVFLVGAYQETLGDLHNLLGDTNVISIRIDDNGRLEFDREVEGDSVADVLSMVEYDPKILSANMRRIAEQAVRAGRITAQDRRRFMEAYESGLRGYTYFESDD